jgi:TM2 domain-containing membrane protein YozV
MSDQDQNYPQGVQPPQDQPPVDYTQPQPQSDYAQQQPYTQPQPQSDYAQQQGAAQQYGYAQQPYTQQPYAQQQYAQQGAPQTQGSQGYQQAASQGWGSAEKDKWVAAALAFVLGSLGIHKFYLGYKSEGMVMLLVTLIGSLCFFIGPIVMAVISIIEAVKYVILTQEDFQATYVVGRRPWL